jgi:hypothetical protein
MCLLLCDDAAQLLKPAREMDLGPGSPNRAVYQQLQAISPETLFAPRSVGERSLSPFAQRTGRGAKGDIDRSMALACCAGLWLLHDFLDESHTISQEIETPTGSYWHAILHRREPDYSNSKYWFRRVGRHPIFPEMNAAARRLAQDGPVDQAGAFLANQAEWDPFRFVDLCEACVAGRAACAGLCRRIQQLEWELLFSYCCRAAVE